MKRNSRTRVVFGGLLFALVAVIAGQYQYVVSGNGGDLTCWVFRHVFAQEPACDEDGTAPSENCPGEHLIDTSVEVLNPTVETDQQNASDIFTVESRIQVQSVVSGKVPLVVTITPEIDSSKAQITWDIPRGLTPDGQTDVWFAMEKGTPVSFRIDVKPDAAGAYEVVAGITAWRYDTNYVSSVRFSFDVDDSLKLTPPSVEYTRNLVLFRGGIGIFSLGLLAALFFTVKYLIARFKKWMSED